MSMREHFLSITRGEGLGSMNRRNVSISPGDEDTLFSGRVAYVDGENEAVEGYGTEPTDTSYFVHRGVELAEVGGLGVVSSTMDKELGTTLANRVSLVPFVPGLEVLTSEFDDEEDYEIGDPIVIESETDGILTLADNADDPTVIGRVAGGINGQAESLIHGLDCLAVEIIKPCPHADDTTSY